MNEYYMKRNEQLFGPHTVEQLKDAAVTYTLKPNEHVANTGAGPCVTASNVSALESPPPSTQPESGVQSVAGGYQLDIHGANESVNRFPSPS